MLFFLFGSGEFKFGYLIVFFFCDCFYRADVFFDSEGDVYHSGFWGVEDLVADVEGEEPRGVGVYGVLV